MVARKISGTTAKFFQRLHSMGGHHALFSRLINERVLFTFLSAIPGVTSRDCLLGHLISQRIPVQRFREVITIY